MAPAHEHHIPATLHTAPYFAKTPESRGSFVFAPQSAACAWPLGGHGPIIDLSPEAQRCPNAMEMANIPQPRRSAIEAMRGRFVMESTCRASSARFGKF